MCGIAGIFHIETAKPVDPERVRRMTDSIAHRGPDGSGVWTSPGVGLGHRRLSIIDLEGSPQPMHTACERFTVSFNGEIYNFRELRRELAGMGHEFRTDGDTEVILAAWKAWGPDSVSRLHGMFAFAIHDAKKRALTLVRDRLGVKPLYYAPLADGSVIFGSELKALLAHPALRKTPDSRAIEDYMAFGYVPDHRCIVAGVLKLPAGHMLPLTLGKPLPQPQTPPKSQTEIKDARFFSWMRSTVSIAHSRTASCRLWSAERLLWWARLRRTPALRLTQPS